MAPAAQVSVIRSKQFDVQSLNNISQQHGWQLPSAANTNKPYLLLAAYLVEKWNEFKLIKWVINAFLHCVV